MTMKNVYDLAVIGAGPAGIVGATTAASLGARVVLIDR
jgi:pyruvate/2-oxoglutarate dehydrogenase complex dihydrolipoamide dehydrogenase (E3) component